VEFVADSLPVSQVLSSYSNSILEFLKYHNPDVLGPLGVSATALSTFVKSTAGYCVITYILGIGDRLVYIFCYFVLFMCLQYVLRTVCTNVTCALVCKDGSGTCVLVCIIQFSITHTHGAPQFI
jgi:Phosphatidylinositol 3- and 4-kinase